MLKTINLLIESLGFGLQKRALHIQFANVSLNSQVFIQRIQGQHFINEGLKVELLCLSTNAHIQLKQFIGSQVAIDQVTDLGKLARTTGIITGASQGQSDGALTLYKLTLEDATSLWHKRRNSRVFMNKSVVEITETLFKEWQSKSALFASSLTLSTEGLKQDYDIRPFVMQANETDYKFLTRLWRSEGINWLVDEADKIVAMSAQPIQAQKLRLIDDNSHFEALSRRSIRFHRSNATERFDTITSFIAQRTIQSNAIQVQRWQADTLAQDQGNTSLSTHKHSEQQDNETLSLEQAWTISPAWISDLNGEDQSTSSGSAQIEKLNTQLTQYQDLQSKYFTAISSVRDADVGYWFEFVGHPEIDQHQGSDREFLILGKRFYSQNNLPKELTTQVEALLDLSRWQKVNPDERVANELSLVRRSIPIVPEYDPLKHRPMAYPQRAKVVGPEGETIFVDQWGRIKVRFVFTRADDHGHDGGAGANDNDTDSAWVDVLTSWAGEGYGSRFHPRIGEIVVIDFFDGNVDRPFVVGRLHEAERYQTMFDVQGQLPDTKKLSGIRSQEVGGAGFNQLRFDDTTGQISTQLQSSHAASQLNLGNLSHPKAQELSDGRGEGFELRTDAYGAVRAGKGMLITTYAQEKAVADHLEAAQAQVLLNQGHESMKMLSELAEKQQTDALNVINRLPKLIQSLQMENISQAASQTLSLFQNDLTEDPLSALKNSDSFVEQMGAFGGESQSTVQFFKDSFMDSQDAMANLRETIETLEDLGTEKLQSRLVSLKSGMNTDPIQVLKKVGEIIEDVKVKPDDLIIGGCFGQPETLTPQIAMNHLKNLMQGYVSDLENSKDARERKQGKLFRQALMLLASPNGIALTTPEDIFMHASSDIGQSSQGSINLSAQKNVIAHAQDKISLFAAQKGLRAFAAKGKLELQAQDDAIEAIARKVIKLISTEDKIEITSPKEIVLTAGGSQLKINASGVFSTTGGKFESKAGQHLFMGGATVNAQLPKMPESGMYSMRFDLSQIFDPNILKNIKYKIINHSKKLESEYEFVQQSSERVYSDTSDEIELALVPGAYLTEIKQTVVEQEAESLEDEEIDGCGCGIDLEHKNDNACEVK
ncbi:type VI secretion system Vgr family protein [Acinetobacter shaoyimingii]|uniref:Type VI secretion system tip protein VgrG n=1 Tax=Acinetobacter shaoyimingii TaxID=2715164 RepID=A0A6G8RZK4_9GAMM|nr:type VI secretion system Vgr family protein [Acinetobacter shaoyimingii]QIO07228.1 type VI secretion system tip protein VgrG [Acinetobacter shaoyimingii]